MNAYHWEESNVLCINFEDMLFDYTSTVAKIESFFGLKAEQHIRKRAYFDPRISIHNCHLWSQYPDESKAMKIIESELKEYIYPYENYNENQIR